MRSSRLGGSKVIKAWLLVVINFQMLVGVKIILWLHEIPTRTDESSQVFERSILRMQPKIMSKMMKSWDEKSIRDLEQVRPVQAHDFLSWLLLSKTYFPRLKLSSWLVI